MTSWDLLADATESEYSDLRLTVRLLGPVAESKYCVYKWGVAMK